MAVKASLAKFIGDLTTLLNLADVQYMITGSLASTYYSEPRSTIDVDIVATASPSNFVEFSRSLDKERFYISSDETILFGSQFNVIETTSGWKLDVMVRKDRPFSIIEFERRRSVKLLLPNSQLGEFGFATT